MVEKEIKRGYNIHEEYRTEIAPEREPCAESEVIMKRRMLYFALSLVLALLLFVPEAVPAGAAEVSSGSCGSNVRWVLDDNGTLTISGSGKMTEHPEMSMNGSAYPEWEKVASRIERVVIEDGVESVPKYAFLRCSKLAEVVIADSVTNIGDRAFFECEALTSVKLPSGLKKIGEFTFRYCVKLKNLTIPSGLTSIDNYAFYCSGLRELELPDSLVYLGSCVFDGCTGLTSMTIPSGMTYVPGSAFQNCVRLTSVTLPSGLTSIGGSAFFGCSALSTLDIPSGVTSIGSQAFNGCSALTELTLPSGLTEISDYSFANCPVLSTLTIPEGVTGIGRYAFFNCSGLTELTLPSGLTKLGESAFSGCSGLSEMTIPEQVTKIEEKTFAGCTALTSVTLPSGVTKIGPGAFNGCSGLTELTLPSAVTEIGSNAFDGCSSLKELTIPSGVKSIASYLLRNCSALTNVTLPSAATEVGPYAFDGCSSLRELTLPSRLTKLGEYALSRCDALGSVTLPSAVTEIGSAAFYHCDGLTAVSIPESVTNIGENAFLRCGRLVFARYGGGLYLGNPENPYLALIGASSENAVSMTVHPDAYVIADGALRGCGSLQELTIPEGVKYIGKEAFYGCAALETVAIPASSGLLGRNAFTGCEKLNEVLYGGTQQRWNWMAGSVSGLRSNIIVTYEAVIEVSFVSVTGITLNRTELVLNAGETAALTAALTPEDASDRTVIWTSSDETAAGVSEDGVVTAKAAGTAVITATADGGLSAVCQVTVQAPPTPGAVPLKLVCSWDRASGTATAAVTAAEELVLSNYDIVLSWDAAVFGLTDIANGQSGFGSFVPNLSTGWISAAGGGENLVVGKGETLAVYTLTAVGMPENGDYGFTLSVRDAATEDGEALVWKGETVSGTMSVFLLSGESFECRGSAAYVLDYQTPAEGDFTVTGERSCIVLCRTGAGLERLTAARIGENSYAYTLPADFDENAEILIAVRGDTDGDGEISAADALQVLRCSAGLSACDEVGVLISDINGDGMLTSTDALQILRVFAELRTLSW